MGKYEETEVRLSVLILMLDQVGVDRGGWGFANELSFGTAGSHLRGPLAWKGKANLFATPSAPTEDGNSTLQRAIRAHLDSRDTFPAPSGQPSAVPGAAAPSSPAAFGTACLPLS